MSAEHGGHGGGGSQSAAMEQSEKAAEAMTDTMTNIILLCIFGFLMCLTIDTTVKPESHHGH